MNFQRVICWLRRDLRLSDHAALAEACRRSREVVIAFVFDANILGKLASKRDRRITFIFDSLTVLSNELSQWGSRLVVLMGDPTEEIPTLAKRLRAEAVFVNEDYESYAVKRDRKVAGALNKQGIQFFSSKDQVVFAPGEILKDDGKPYQVFTPYSKNWLRTLSFTQYEERKPVLKKLVSAQHLAGEPTLPAFEALGFQRAHLDIAAGEVEGERLCRHFFKRISRYKETRDFPAQETTSRLSVHLRFGTISVRKLVRLALKEGSPGAKEWIRELIWRDFFFMILHHFPHVEKQAFKEKYDDIKWPGKPDHFQAWCEGRTGFPIVDAGMRQLNATGFMHNRLRMITASFLVKDLLIDWREGERYFAETLLDYDLAANNGGWQWSASTGCDAQPYFRVFNPDAQAKRFDSDGEFVRQWVPEALVEGSGYPEPIVDHETQRRRVIALFKKI